MKHTIVLIHGISDGDGPHDFDKFWEQLGEEYCKRHKADLNDFFVAAPIEWDVATNEGETSIFEACFGGIRESDKYLVHGNLFQTGKALSDIRAWRYFSTFLAGDVIAYIDESDNEIRRTAWEGLRHNLEAADGTIKKFSIIGHSLGSVIAYDFIYALMERDMLFNFDNKPDISADISKWQDSFLNLYTMGSPIGLFMMRRKNLWANQFGELVNPVDNSKLNRRWLNLWDRDDLVAYPLEKIFGQKPGRTIRDVEVDTGMIMPWAHTQYWSDRETVSAIASTLPLPDQVR